MPLVAVKSTSLATGGIDTLDLGTDQRKLDVFDKIQLLEPDKSPLVVLLSRLRRSKAMSPKVEWLEDFLLPKTTLNTAIDSATDTSIGITAGEGDYFKVGDLIKDIRTGEVMRVTATSANTLTVTRGFSGTAAATAVGDELLCVGHASAENSNAPQLITTVVANQFNFTQIFRTPFGGSRTVDSSELYGGNNRSYDRFKMGIEHLKDIETAFFFGLRKEDTVTVSGRPLRTLGGVEQFVTTNVTTLDSSGLDSTTDLEDFLRTGFRFGNSSKFLFASALTIQKINELALGKIFTVSKDDVFGLTIMKYISSHGEVNLIKSKVFEGPQTKGMAFLVDIENLGYKYMDDTFLRTNIQANDADGWADEFLSEVTLTCMMEKTHAILKNTDGGTF